MFTQQLLRAVGHMLHPSYVDSDPLINRGLCAITKRHVEVRVYDARDGLDSAIPVVSFCKRCNEKLEPRPLVPQP